MQQMHRWRLGVFVGLLLGAAVGVACNGAVVYVGACGLANVERQEPVTKDTVFDLASNSKQFTAVAVMLLMDRGQLSATDELRKYCPEYPAYPRPVHLGEVLHMTAGLPDYMRFFDDHPNLDNAELVKLVGKLPQVYPTGEKCEYSNAAFATLALVVSRVAKEPFGPFLQRHLFAPVGMTHTVVLTHAKQAVPGREQGYTVKKDGTVQAVRDDTNVVGDGQVMSSVVDLLAWDATLRAGKLFKPDTLQAAYTPGRLANGKDTDYGYGLSIADQDGHHWGWHSGGWTGAATYTSRCLDAGWTVVVLSNNDKFDAEQTGVAIERLLVCSEHPRAKKKAPAGE